MLFISKYHESLDKLINNANESLLKEANFSKYVASVMRIMKETNFIVVHPAPRSTSEPVQVRVNVPKDAEVPDSIEKFNKLFFNEWLDPDEVERINANATKTNGLDETNGWLFIYKSPDVKGKHGSGSKSRGRSWGEKVEYIVCEAFNQLRKNDGNLPDDWDWSSYEFSPDMEAHGKRTDEAKTDFFKKIYESLSNAGIKEDLIRYTGDDEVDTKWKDKGHYEEFGSKISNEAKTDIMTVDGKIKISMKKVDTDKDRARLASSSVCDSLAIITTAIENAETDYSFREEFSKRILELSKKTTKTRSNFTPGATVTSVNKRVKNSLGENIEAIADILLEDEDPDIKELAKMSLLKKAFGETIIEYVTSDPEVRDQIIIEAVSGKAKFGASSKSCANAILVWNESGKCKLYGGDENGIGIKKYVKDECKGYKIKAAFKSSDNKFWVVMSIL